MTITSCKICGNSQANQIHRVKEMMFGTGHRYDYLECAACRCLQLVNPPERPDEYYPEAYYSFAARNESSTRGLNRLFNEMRTRASLASENTLANRFVRFFLGEQADYALLRQLPMHKSTRFVDVGTGSGKFLIPLYLAGYTQCLGIDPFIEDDIVYPFGLKIKKATVFDLQGEFDVVFYNHSFEHIPEPRAELFKVRDILATNGTFVISVPVFPSLAWDLFGVDWYQIDAPRHYFLHSTQSMACLADSAGFKVTSVHYNSTYAQFAFSAMYQKGITMKDRSKNQEGFLRRKFNKLKYSRWARQQNKRGYGDQAVFFLVRNECQDERWRESQGQKD